jgi:hypothetical protein
MSKYQNFIFKDYIFDQELKTLKLSYSYDNLLDFCETYKFNFDYVNYDKAELDMAFSSLFFIAGVSYYKAYLAPNIEINKGHLDANGAAFFGKTYKKGLGEFFYVNNIDPNFPIDIPATDNEIVKSINNNGSGLLIGIGGGKDSLVSVEILRGSGHDITTWSLGHRSQLEPLINVIGLPHLWVEREWDPALLELNDKDALNGHIPISSIFAAVGSVVAILSGKKIVIVSNESSANEPDLVYRGVEINHQYSKSLEFEKNYQNFTESTINSSYYSFLRPLTEVYISEIFSKIGFDKYRGVFSSCNRAFTHNSDHIFWCGECAKCAFTFLALTPFIERAKLEEIWGKNLLLDPGLDMTYKKLLGIEADKPLDCVGEIKESRAAMRLAQNIYPELDKYIFELPSDYNYKSLSDHSMPGEMYTYLISKLEILNN